MPPNCSVVASHWSVAIGSHRIQVADDQPTFWDKVAAGAWEPGTLGAVAAHVGPGTLFVDLGAWVGPLSMYAAALGARVIAVEADPRALDQLRRNLAANPDLAERVTVVPRAVSPDHDPVRLGARRKPGDSMSSVLLHDAATTWSADALTPDELAGMVAEGERLVVKLDIEGGEYALLPTLTDLLSRPDAVLLVSLHPVILAGTGVADTAAAALTALSGLASLDAATVEDHAVVPRAVTREALTRHDVWLFTSRSRAPDLGRPLFTI